MEKLLGVTNRWDKAYRLFFFFITLSLFFAAGDAFAANVILMRGDTVVGNYSTIQEAYNQCQDQDVIEAQATQAMTFYENPNFNLSVAVLFKGGYDSLPGGSQVGMTTVQGTVTISGGTLTVDDLTIQGAPTYSISGTVTYNGVGLSGVSMALTGAGSATVTTDSNGNYTFSGLSNGDYAITPSKPNYTFTPQNSLRTVSGSNITAVNFAASVPVYTIYGSVWDNNGSGPVQGVTLTLNTVPTVTTTTDSGGNYNIPNIPNGTYTITPTLPGSSAIFYPANSLVTISGNDIYNVNFTASVGHNISGTINYSGSKSGRIYIGLYQYGNLTWHGTSISSPGAFTIRGVPAGTYQLAAIRDIFGYGTFNAADPAGLGPTTTVTSGDLTGQNITLSDPAPATPTTPTGLSVSPGSQSAVIRWNGTYNNINQETATDYKIYWGTDANASNGGSKTVPANGQQAYIQSGLTNGVNYYYKISALVGTTESGPSVVGPITIGAGTGAYTVSGTVTIPVTATGPLYVGVVSTSKSNNNIYFAKIALPSSSQPYSVSGVPNGTYNVFAFVDMNNDGQPDIGDLSVGMNGDSSVTVTINNSNVTQNLTVLTANAIPAIQTSHWTDGTNVGYQLNLDITGIMKLPVKVALTSGPNVFVPVDIQTDYNDNPGRFSFWVGTDVVRPSVGDTYSFSVTYKDGTTETINAQVSAVLDSFARNLIVTPNPSNSIPTFSWSAPVSPPASYTYDIDVNQNYGDVWYYPRHSDGMPSSQTSVQYDIDGSANQPSLSLGTQYNWQITVRDANGNSATYQTSYTP